MSIAIKRFNKPMTDFSLDRRKFLTRSLIVAGAILIPVNARCREIREMNGDVFVSGQRADAATAIKSGDNIITGGDGQVTFTVGKDGFMVRPDTVLELETGDGAIIKGLRLVTGALLAVFGKGGYREIMTDTAVIGIRGTGLYLDVKPERTYFCTCYGKTTITDAEHSLDISSRHHEAYNITFNDTGVMTMKATEVIGHTDQELRQLESYFGRKPPFDT